MAYNIFGPYGSGVNPTTSRPDDVDDPGAVDTFFQPCSNPLTNDGTLVSYRWLNKLLATLRRATRGMGIADDSASDDLLLEAIRRGATLRNTGAGVDLYVGQAADKAHLLRRVSAGANVTLTLVDGPVGEQSVRIGVTVPGEGPTGNTIGNVGDGADVYKGTNGSVEEIRGIKGIGPIAAVESGDGNNIEVGMPVSAYQIMMRDAGTSGQVAGKTIAALTAEAAPADDDYLLLGKHADGAPRKVSVGTIRAVQDGVGSYTIQSILWVCPVGQTWEMVGLPWSTSWYLDSDNLLVPILHFSLFRRTA